MASLNPCTSLGVTGRPLQALFSESVLFCNSFRGSVFFVIELQGLKE